MTNLTTNQTELSQFLTIEQAKKEGNSNTNQSIKAKFIQQHVYANVNSLVEYIMQAQLYTTQVEPPFTHEDIENLFVPSEENEEDYEAQDVYEWWMVSSYLLEKLKEKGCPIIDNENIWGRTTTGQAILLDYVITEICAEMKILQGQENSWEKAI